MVIKLSSFFGFGAPMSEVEVDRRRLVESQTVDLEELAEFLGHELIPALQE